MVLRYRNIQDLGRMVADYVPRANPIISAGIVEVLASVNGTQMVKVRRAGYVRPALYPLEGSPVVNGGVFITRMGSRLNAPLFVIASNYQVPWVDDYFESPILMTEVDPGPDGVYGTWDDIHYLMREQDGYYLRDG